jgi:hypothetical protein
MEYNIKIVLWETELDGMDWIHMAQERDWWWAHVITAVNFLVL